MKKINYKLIDEYKKEKSNEERKKEFNKKLLNIILTIEKNK